MELKYLKELQENPTKKGILTMTNQPIPESEVRELEQFYNDGKEFPLALRELLFLAGSYCYVLEYGIFKTQQEMQESVRNDLKERDKRINEPFFVIDVYGGSQCLFVYLNNGDDPAVYEAVYWEEEEWFYCICPNLSTYISNLIERVKEGRNPF